MITFFFFLKGPKIDDENVCEMIAMAYNNKIPEIKSA